MVVYEKTTAWLGSYLKYGAIRGPKLNILWNK